MALLTQLSFAKKLKTSILLCLVVASHLALHGQNLSDAIPLDPQVKIGKLSNGLTYYIRKNARPEKKVELRLVVNAGSILEEDDQQGLAHFTEHMAFNGSKNFKKNDIVSFLQSIGVEFGADLNAYTGFDETVYILPIPTEKKENVEKGFQILEDWASTVAFEDAEIDKERGVVLEESRLGKGAEDRIFRVVYPKMFEGSQYANRLPIGRDEILKNFQYDAIRRFYHDWYRPDLMAVIVVGDIEPLEAEQLIKKYFDKLKNPDNAKARKLAEVPARKKSEGLVVTDKEATNYMVEIYYNYEKLKEQKTLGDYREYLVRRLFTSMLSQRMQELTQKADPPFIYGGSFIGGYARGYEAFQSLAYAGKRGVEVAIKALVNENERARQFGFTDAELERTKKNFMKSIERAYHEKDKTESDDLAEEYIRNFLEEEPVPGIEAEYQIYQSLLNGISVEEVNQYTSRTIPGADAEKLVVLTGPEQDNVKLPTGEDILKIVIDAAKEKITAYEEKTVASSLLDKTPVAGKITFEKENKTIGVTELHLGNGINVLLKPTDFKNDQIVMAATRFGGQYQFNVKDRFNAEFASTVISQMGVGSFSPTDLRKFLAGKSVSVSTRIGALTESVSGQCSTTDLETMLQLTHLYFTQPRDDKELFQSYVSKQQALYQNMDSDPDYTFQDSVIRTLYKNHPWAPKLPKPETFAKLDEPRILQLYKERFQDANGFNFVIVGKFDISTIKPLLALYLGSLPSSQKKSTFKDVGLRPVKGVVKKEVIKGKEEKSLIRLFWNGEAKFDVHEQLKIQALTEVLNIKVIETLREDLGGIYGGGFYGTMNKYPYNNYSIGVSLPCGPENVDKLIRSTLDEIDKIKKQGPSETDLNKVKETWKQQYEVNVKENSFWLRQLIQSIEMGIPAEEILSYEKRINALTVADIKGTAEKYMNMKNFIQIVLYPEK